MRNKIILLLFAFLFSYSGYSQSDPSTWIELGFSKNIVKNLKVELNPELRMYGGFKMDAYIFEGGLSYKLHKYLTLASYYRYEDEYQYKKKSGEYKGQESSQRIAIDAKSGFELNRFDFQFRVRYTNGLFINNTESEFRYRAKINYDIKNSKLVPFASAEFFHDQTVLDIERDLIAGSFKTFDKARYTAGIAYNISKNDEICLFYRLQNNRIKVEKTTIIGLSYSHDF
jgi:hypothetical protein